SRCARACKPAPTSYITTPNTRRGDLGSRRSILKSDGLARENYPNAEVQEKANEQTRKCRNVWNQLWDSPSNSNFLHEMAQHWLGYLARHTELGLRDLLCVEILSKPFRNLRVLRVDAA